MIACHVNLAIYLDLKCDSFLFFLFSIAHNRLMRSYILNRQGAESDSKIN